ncbi:zinc-binding dehydrogenase [Streptomyces sp. NPDC001177]
MHAIRLHAFGPAGNLTYEQVEDPVPGPGQVRVAVAAAGVHLLDTGLREGVQGPAPAPTPLPTVPGREVAGVVESLGEGTPERWLGRRVVAHLGFAPGGYAELAVTDAGRLHEIPDGLDFAQAVAMIGTAGGIGTLLVQYAKNAGATVIGLAGGPEKVARVAKNGADLAVDYLGAAWPEQVRGYLGERPATVVFDGVGGDVAREAVALLGPGGQHLVFGWSAQGISAGQGYVVDGVSEQVLGPAILKRAGGPDPVRTLELRALAEAAAGRLTPAVTRFPLAEAATAHRALEGRGTVGKVVLEP